MVTNEVLYCPQIGRAANVRRHGRWHTGQRALPAGEPASRDASVPSPSQPAEPRARLLALPVSHRQALPAPVHVEMPGYLDDMPLRHTGGYARLFYR